MARQTFYGFRAHPRLSWPGVIAGFSAAPANAHDLAPAPELVEGGEGTLPGDRNYRPPLLTEELRGEGLTLPVPFESKKKDPWPNRSYRISRPRCRIGTVFSRLAERFRVRRVQVRGNWRPRSRLPRQALSHTLAFAINLARLLA